MDLAQAAVQISFTVDWNSPSLMPPLTNWRAHRTSPVMDVGRVGILMVLSGCLHLMVL